jgi:uncharacterized protein YecA (UPF0149 family)
MAAPAATISSDPLPLEQTDPEAAELIRQIVNKEHPLYRGFYARESGVKFLLRRDLMLSLGRNDPCPCGSGKKFKKCHQE